MEEYTNDCSSPLVKLCYSGSLAQACLERLSNSLLLLADKFAVDGDQPAHDILYTLAISAIEEADNLEETLNASDVRDMRRSRVPFQTIV